MKTRRGTEVCLHSFLISLPLNINPLLLYLKEEPPYRLNRKLGGFYSHLDILAKSKSIGSAGIWTPNSPARSLVAVPPTLSRLLGSKRSWKNLDHVDGDGMCEPSGKTCFVNLQERGWHWNGAWGNNVWVSEEYLSAYSTRPRAGDPTIAGRRADLGIKRSERGTNHSSHSVPR